MSAKPGWDLPVIKSWEAAAAYEEHQSWKEREIERQQRLLAAHSVARIVEAQPDYNQETVSV